jgi:hypothetical protein
MRFPAIGVGLLSTLACSAGAQVRSIVGSLGAQHLQSEGTGLSMLVGIAASRSVFMASLPLEISLLPNNNGRYTTETFSNGQSRCRDTTNGQFADSSLCGPRAVLGASLDALAFMRPDSMHAVGFGGGYRVGPSGGLFAAASFVFGAPSGASWDLKARGGASMLELSIGGAIPWR